MMRWKACGFLGLLGLLELAHAELPPEKAAPTLDPKDPKRPRLLIENRFKEPEEVVRHYCERDAWGFIWAGMSEQERNALTTWKASPSADTFYLAFGYQLQPTRKTNPTTAEVPVVYDIFAVGDPSGTRSPSDRLGTKIVYRLQKFGAQWKIIDPAPPKVAPIVLQHHFPRPPSPSLPGFD